jgi:3-deoxy-D-manno-octulosonic-acid transferase
MTSPAETVWSALATLAAPALRLMLRGRVRRGKEWPDRLGERWGIASRPRPAGSVVWIHAASVGETMSILPLLSGLTGRDPELTILLTTGTVTSAGLLEERLPKLGLTSRVMHQFVPLDVPAWSARFLDHWRPDVAAFVESELWPNILGACRARGVPAMLINARMSARSFKSWSRLPSVARALLGGFALIHARGQEDADRLIALGARDVATPGDLKLAAPPLPADPDVLASMTAHFADRPVWLAASTHAGEEPLIAAVHAALLPRFPDLLTVIVPRHPERGPGIADALSAPSRGRGEAPPEGGIWIADTLGELGLWYRLCPVVFVGGSLLPPGGGQNLLEPARLGCAISAGSYTGNFTEHADLLRAADALTVTPDTAALTRFVDTMLRDPAARGQMGERARRAVQGSDKVVAETVAALLALRDRGSVR